MNIGFFIDALITVVGVTTPILLAATGELVVEKSGVLNLGIEGMMIVGAACGFAAAYFTGSVTIGAIAGAAAGAGMSAIFALLTLGLAVNQVAAGLALTAACGPTTCSIAWMNSSARRP